MLQLPGIKSRCCSSSSFVSLLLLLPFFVCHRANNVASAQRQQQEQQQEEDHSNCRIACLHNTSCVRGDADFSWHPKQPGSSNGQEFEFHQELSRNGWHCDCPFGLTGLRCGKKYETCDGSDGNTDHVCYNGGTCIDGLQDVYGNNQLYCQCPPKFEDQENGTMVQYTGKYCEIEIDSTVLHCDANDDQSYCVNGGTCKADAENHHVFPCDCPSGYTGRHCEFAVGTVPACTLECQNGGECMLGQQQQQTMEAYIDISVNGHHVNDTNNNQNRSDDFQHCLCPKYFTGDSCEIDTRQCGDIRCLHGSTCVEIEHAGGRMEYFCDCSTASTESKKFAGRHCQLRSTVLCGDDGMFCTRGGTCPTTPLGNCDCPDGYVGSHCEIGVDEIVHYNNNNNDSNNNNGSTGSNGATISNNINDNDNNDNIGSNGATITTNNINDDEQNSNSNAINGDDNNNDNNVHDDDNNNNNNESTYISTIDTDEIIKNSEKNDSDSDGNHNHCGDLSCAHGSSCMEIKNSPVGTTFYHCDCTTAFTETNKFAGNNCQHKSTVLCPDGFMFCTRNGTCPSQPLGDCDCPDGFGGSHCEFSTKELLQFENEVNNNENNFNNVEVGSGSNSDNDSNNANGNTDKNNNPNCALDCRNGGKCRKGSKPVVKNEDFTRYGPELEHMKLNVTFSSNFEHCQCPDGYAGLQCEYKYETCDTTDHPCFYGSTCKPDPYNPGLSTCVCSDAAGSPGANLVAGIHCQHLASEICPSTNLPNVPNNPSEMEQNPWDDERMYCVNQGICDVDPTGNPVCRCAGGYHGPHCEFMEDTSSPSPFFEHVSTLVPPSGSSSSMESHHHNQPQQPLQEGEIPAVHRADPPREELPPPPPTIEYEDQQSGEIIILNPGYYSNFSNREQYTHNGEEEDSAAVSSILIVNLAIIFTVVFILFSIHRIQHRHDNLKDGGDCPATYPDLQYVSRPYSDHNINRINDYSRNASSNNSSTVPSADVDVITLDGSGVVAFGGGGRDTTFLEKGDGGAAIVRNMVGSDIIDENQYGNGLDEIRRKSQHVLSSIMARRRKRSGASLTDGVVGVGGGGVAVGNNNNGTAVVGNSSENGNSLSGSESVVITFDSMSEENSEGRHSLRSTTSVRSNSQRSHSSVPYIDMGPEKDFDGNELNDVVIT